MFTSKRLFSWLGFCLLVYKNNADTTANSWNSLKDCVDKFPEIETFVYGLGFGGQPALKHEFPHAAALGWTQLGGEIRWACGGSLITEDTVLTAAHCTFDRNQKQPDKIRFGDLNLETDDDDKETQQFDVLNIIRHPQYSAKTRYHDIAVIKLQLPVNVTKFVTPACLWPNPTVNKYSELEACGFGQTEFGGPISPILNKIIVSPFNNQDCIEHYTNDRKLPTGIIDSHLCASDKTGKLMDTCEGDSGGPLEMKLLLYNNVIPFIVGVTAFGKGCGSNSPGVYTRVSSYIDWIETQANIIKNPLECAQKYKDFRYYDLYSFLGGTSFAQKEILGEKNEEKCYGMLLTNTYLVTSASCVANMFNPTRVLDDEEHRIQKIIYHPNFNKNRPSTADVALIKLKTEMKWSQYTRPTCISQISNLENARISEYETYFVNKEKGSRDTNRRNIIECLDYYNINDISKYDETLTCFDAGNRHVPSACQIPLGSGIVERNLPEKDGIVTVTRGLALYSEDCGPVLTTDLTAYIDWMDSIIFQKSQQISRDVDSDTPILFHDAELDIDDPCFIPGSDLIGRCTSKEKCTTIKDKPALICGGSNPSTVCCPFT